MLWVKAFHIIFMVAWYAGLLYLPRLFVYHAMSEDAPSRARFEVMERKLFGIMTVGAVGAFLFGMWLLLAYAWEAYVHSAWLHLKLLMVALLIAYHVYCHKLMLEFRRGQASRSHVFYRWINEVPALMLLVIVILVVVKPF